MADQSHPAPHDELPQSLLSDRFLEQSGIVANCRMNRERSLTGSNGYSRELGFNPVEWLQDRLKTAQGMTWLDLCCGSGRALVEAAEWAETQGLQDVIEIVGVDLVGNFSKFERSTNCLRMIEASVSTWIPPTPFDLITCVHGLHYLGDKLGLIAKASSWLTDTGHFVANLSLKNIKVQDQLDGDRIVRNELRRNGLSYNKWAKRISFHCRNQILWQLRYLGADDQAGPNYTGQPAVDSYYAWSGTRAPEA